MVLWCYGVYDRTSGRPQRSDTHHFLQRSESGSGPLYGLARRPICGSTQPTKIWNGSGMIFNGAMVLKLRASCYGVYGKIADAHQ